MTGEPLRLNRINQPKTPLARFSKRPDNALVTAMIPITRQLAIAEREIREIFIRAPGPGGQHVNKAATAVQVRFDVAHSPSLPPEVRDRLMTLAGRRLTDEGVLEIEARRYRSQERNRQDARNRLIALIRQAAEPRKARHRTKPPPAADERRLEAKRRRAGTKQQRRRIPPVEE